MFRLDGRVALVTGAARGIGRATAVTLARQGATVVVNYEKSEAAAQQVVDQIAAQGGHAEISRFDVSDSSAVDAAIAQIIAHHRRLDVLVANAGIAIDGLLLRGSDNDLDRMMGVNLRGAMACARAALRTMIRARYGRIVFVSSVVAELGNSGQTAYAATKAALLGLTRSLAREVGSRTVTVNAVAPGLVDTDMTARLGPEVRAEITAQVPLRRLGTPEDVAAAVAFLASDEAAYITGQTLRVNGGMYA